METMNPIYTHDIQLVIVWDIIWNYHFGSFI